MRSRGLHAAQSSCLCAPLALALAPALALALALLAFLALAHLGGVLLLPQHQHRLLYSSRISCWATPRACKLAANSIQLVRACVHTDA